MAKIYYNRVKNGLMTLNMIPEKWRKAVEELLEA